MEHKKKTLIPTENDENKAQCKMNTEKEQNVAEDWQ